MTTETTETIEDEPETETVQPIEAEGAWRARVASELAAAEASAEACREVERAAYLRVDTARGDHQIGNVDRGTWLKAARVLSAAQEATAAADSKVRAVEREHARQLAGRAAVARAVRILDRDVREAEIAHSRERSRELFAAIASCLVELDRLPGLPPLSSAGRAYDQAMSGLNNLRALFLR